MIQNGILCLAILPIAQLRVLIDPINWNLDKSQGQNLIILKAGNKGTVTLAPGISSTVSCTFNAVC